MIWNCNDKIKEIKFKYCEWSQEYSCCINRASYARESGICNAGPWGWFMEGYTATYTEWV